MGKSLRYFSKAIPDFRFPPELGTTAVNVQMQEEDYGKNRSKLEWEWEVLVTSSQPALHGKCRLVWHKSYSARYFVSYICLLDHRKCALEVSFYSTHCHLSVFLRHWAPSLQRFKPTMSSHACRGKGINLMPDIPWYFYTEVKHSQPVPMEMLVEKQKEFLPLSTSTLFKEWLSIQHKKDRSTNR